MAVTSNPEPGFKEHREYLDRIDERLVKLLAWRYVIVEQLMRSKRAMGLPAHDPAREAEMDERFRALAHRYGIDPETLVAIFEQVRRGSLSYY